MKTLIINISLRPDSFQCIFPIGIGYIATAIKNAGIPFDILDMDVYKFQNQAKLRETLKKGYDVIAMGCIVTGYRIIKEISGIIREVLPNATIIVGNTVASSIPHILLKNTKVDVAVIGEGDKIIVDLLRIVEKGERPKGIHQAKEPIDLAKLPMLEWSLFDMKKYLTKNRDSVSEPYPIGYVTLMAMPINSARGCIHNCTFCYHAFKGYKYRCRPTKNIREEIIYLKGKYDINYVTFYDDLTLFNKKRANDFADMMMGMGVHWTAACRAGLFKESDLELLHKLKRSNLVSLGYSLESANAGILKSMNKHISLEDFAVQKRMLTRADIATITSLVIGYPQETPGTLTETFDFCYDNGIFPSTGYLQPQPGTPMYEYSKDNGYIPDEEAYLLKMGDRQDLTINLTTIPSDRLEKLVVGHLMRIRDKLKLPLRDDQMLKTGIVRGRK